MLGLVKNQNQVIMIPNQKIVVKVPVKSYVKRFLEINYGNPVNFSDNSKSHQFFQSILRKSINSKINTEISAFYREVVVIEITEHDFEHYGWEISKANVLQFNRYFEKQAKILMRNVIGVNAALGLPIKTAIEKFQSRFKFDEDTWNAEAIKKDFYRHGQLDTVDFTGEIFNKIEKIVLRNLYD